MQSWAYGSNGASRILKCQVKYSRGFRLKDYIFRDRVLCIDKIHISFCCGTGTFLETCWLFPFLLTDVLTIRLF